MGTVVYFSVQPFLTCHRAGSPIYVCSSAPFGDIRQLASIILQDDILISNSVEIEKYFQRFNLKGSI